MRLIDKDVLVAEIEKRKADWQFGNSIEAKYKLEECKDILSFLNAFEVKDDDAEKYSFNIESQLFPQLTKEQQKLWKKEIEQAYMAGKQNEY